MGNNKFGPTGKRVVINLSEYEAKFVLKALGEIENFLNACYQKSPDRIKEEYPQFLDYKKYLMSIRTKIANAPSFDLKESDLNPKRGGVSIG